MAGAEGYFRWVVRAGVLVNLSLAVPAVFAPAPVLSLFGLQSPPPAIWPRFAALLLVLLSLFYLPAASNPRRSPAASWLTVAARVAGVAFFAVAVPVLDLSWRYLLFGLLDLVFAVSQGVLLALALRGPGPSSLVSHRGAVA
jgi:hypothetical protein